MKRHVTATDKIRPSQVMKDRVCVWLAGSFVCVCVGSWDKTPPSDDSAHTVIKVNETPVTFTYTTAL